ncbi:hypothetical protein [Actinomadura rudentiformis]|uniref:Uncharacterized protein n=1 Tax=Actinomadura rudentiformis TaxID=359158 RepID=A0A6H9Z6N6_9ACTN|nr:hypothetical protein [Actinomadura rudentiformis]KAB2351749.1 hypothetical protein F8566_05930 [Actinomadura rudentiformis]
MQADTPGYLATRYDHDRAGPVPAQLTDGKHPVLRVTEGFLRRTGNVGRCIASPAAFGLSAAAIGDGPARVTLRLSLDRHTPTYWDRYVHEDVPRSGAERPRLVVVCAQREVRGALLLAPRPVGQGRAIGELGVTLAPDELPAGGLALFELWGAHEWRSASGAAVAAASALAPQATTGMVVNTISVGSAAAPPVAWSAGDTLDARTSERLGLVSTGGLNAQMLTEQGSTFLSAGMLVVNPCAGASARLTFGFVRGTPPVLRGAKGGPRWRRHMDRARRKARVIAQRGLEAAASPGPHVLDWLQVQAVGLGDGAVTTLPVSHRPEGGFTVVVPAQAQPILLTISQQEAPKSATHVKLIDHTPI